MGQKIAIASSEKQPNALASNRFARCECFAIYDRHSDSFDCYDNFAKGEASGAGNKAAKILGDLNVDVVLVPEVGPKAFDMLHAFDIDVYKYEKNQTVKDVLKSFLNQELKRVTGPSTKGKH